MGRSAFTTRKTTTTIGAAGSVQTRGTLNACPTSLHVVYFIMLGLFLLCAWAACVSTYQGWRSHGFHEVEGTVSDVWTSRTTMRPGGASRSPSKTSYLHVTYTYSVGGVIHHGDRIQAGTFGFANGADLKAFGARFSAGQRVPVYVDPGDPSNAVLVPGYSNMMTMFYALAGFFGLAALMLGVFRGAARMLAPSTDRRPPVPAAVRGAEPAARKGRARPLP